MRLWCPCLERLDIAFMSAQVRGGFWLKGVLQRSGCVTNDSGTCTLECLMQLWADAGSTGKKLSHVICVDQLKYWWRFCSCTDGISCHGKRVPKGFAVYRSILRIHVRLSGNQSCLQWFTNQIRLWNSRITNRWRVFSNALQNLKTKIR